jgi:hypothetical protein
MCVGKGVKYSTCIMLRLRPSRFRLKSGALYWRDAGG